MQEHKYVGGFIAAWYAGDVSQQLSANFNLSLGTMIALESVFCLQRSHNWKCVLGCLIF